MITLRVRFSGLCLFYMESTDVMVRVLDPPGHAAQLWLDTATGENGTQRKPDADGVKECALAKGSNGQLKATWRTVDKFKLTNERITFANGQGSGPTRLPGVASLRSVHPGLGDVDRMKPFGAELKLNHGRFSLGTKRGVAWNDKHPHGQQPSLIPLWVDLLVDTTDTVFRIDSSAAAGGWELKPVNQQVDVWLLADGTGGMGQHFKHLFDYCDQPRFKPWPTLKHGLPSCSTGDRIKPRKVGSTFCPDGEYP